jgi:perosamine synthetase
MAKNGSIVSEFEKAFAEFVGAKYCIAVTNGTVSIEAALVAMGVKRGDRVAVPPITMAATTLAVLKMGGVPVFVDVDPDTWLMKWTDIQYRVPVSLYGLHAPDYGGRTFVDDAAQTLRPHNRRASFTSYSFQKSKHLSLGEGGAIVTNDAELAKRARWYTSLGYDLSPDSSKIDPAKIKSPDYIRHIDLIPEATPTNARMNEITAAEGLRKIRGSAYYLEQCVAVRRWCAEHYAGAVQGCEWIAEQFVPEGWTRTHDYWCYAIALKDKSLWKPFTEAVVRHGGEMPYGAWRLTYQEPAFRHLTPHRVLQVGNPASPTLVETSKNLCPIAESLQPRLVQFQTNDLASTERNAKAVRKAIEEINLVSAFKEARDLIDAQPVPRHVFSPDATGIPCE